MKRAYKNLNNLLRFYADNIEEIGIEPETAIIKAKIDVNKTEAFLICKMMMDDGYLYLPNIKLIRYSANYKAKLFLDEGGYVTQKRIANRKRKLSWMIDNFDFLKYPIGLTLSIFIFYKLLKELNII